MLLLGERTVLSKSERRVLRIFREFLIGPGQMLCFYGPNLKKCGPAIQQLIARGFLTKEKFKGAYSLTHTGFAAIKDSA